jgi:hypothetical protein
LSTVVSFKLDEDLLPDLAITVLPLFMQRHFKAVTVPYRIWLGVGGPSP